jgi:PIN domain nuclease of toxin-antitoxin system
MGGTARLNLLLDTHIWVWLVSESQKLGKQTLRELQKEENEIWLSPISTWEVLTLHRKKRILLEPTPRDWLDRATICTREAPLSHEIAFAAMQLSIHQDPADRFLAATAQVLDLVLVTADELLLGLGNIRTLANR